MSLPESHPGELQLLLYTDAALPADEAARVAAHLADCAACQASQTALQAESAAIGSALRQAPEGAEVPVPAFKRPASLRGFAMANLALGLAIWLPQFLWKTLFGELVVNGTEWLTATYLPDTYDLASSAALHLLNEGTAMFETYLVFIVTALAAATAVWLILLRRGRRGLEHLLLLALVGGGLALPAPADALELRRSDTTVIIAADEVVDDTLVVTAQRVVVAGRITGDLVAMAEDVDITGSVGGNLVSFGRSVHVAGPVGGLLLGAASRLHLEGAAVEGDVWVAGDRVDLDAASRVGGNLALAAESATVAAPVGHDLYSAAETLEVGAAVGADLEAAGRRLILLEGAHVAGDVRLRLPGEDHFTRAASAQIDGELVFLDPPEDLDYRSPWLQPAFWLWRLAGLIGAVLVGVTLLWLFPGLRNRVIPGGLDGLKTAGLGLVAIISAPVLAALAAATIIGLPFGLIGLAAWLLLLYLAKVVVGIVVGRMALGSSERADNLWLVVLVGMLLVTVAVNLPWIGGAIGFVVTAFGAGLIVQWLYASRSGDAAA